MDHSTLRSIVELVPHYAHSRRAGWTPELATGSRLTLPEYLLLRRVAIEQVDQPVLFADLRSNALNPYWTVDPLLDRMPRLVELNLLSQANDAYSVTPAGVDVLMRGEPSANDYAARRLRLPANDVATLADILHAITERQRLAPEPADKAHQDRVPRLQRFDSRQTPPVQLEYALYALQRARDDAHIAAWRAAGFQGPSFDLLSRVWTGEATTHDDLVGLTRGRIRRDDVERMVEHLARAGYLELRYPELVITDFGRAVRDEVERETDRVFFTPWPEIDAAWVRRQLEALAANLAL